MGEHEVADLNNSSVVEIACRHHWLIEPPSGSTSSGVCKLCGATKEFDNLMPSRASISTQTYPQRTAGDKDEQVPTTS